MISLEEAKKKARELIPQVDNCIEYEDAYVFGVSGDESIGDDPIVILKQNGKAIWMTAYRHLLGVKTPSLVSRREPTIPTQ